jgi:hypothetical protein
MTPTDSQWERRLGDSIERLHTLGLPQATEVYRRPTGDGHLWGLVQQDDRGWTLVLTHTALDPVSSLLIPGRLPTLVECYAARRQLLPEQPLMVILLTRTTQVLLHRLHYARPGVMPQGSGLPTTVRCVQAYIEDLTDDCLLGPEP